MLIFNPLYQRNNDPLLFLLSFLARQAFCLDPNPSVFLQFSPLPSAYHQSPSMLNHSPKTNPSSLPRSIVPHIAPSATFPFRAVTACQPARPVSPRAPIPHTAAGPTPALLSVSVYQPSWKLESSLLTLRPVTCMPISVSAGMLEISETGRP
jgi:hypothetical protein